VRGEPARVLGDPVDDAGLALREHYPPEQDRDLDDFYELVVFDPDGIRVEIACEAPAL
jgi:hypothetical protein